jgi:Flp pilus assembly protein TadG
MGVSIRCRRERGSTVVESALAMTVFFMLVLGIMDMSCMVMAHNTLAYAAREGIRWASVRGAASGSPADAAMVSAYVKSRMISLNPAAAAVTTTWTPNNNAGSTINITVTYAYTPVAPFLPSPALTLRSRSHGYVAR